MITLDVISTDAFEKERVIASPRLASEQTVGRSDDVCHGSSEIESGLGIGSPGPVTTIVPPCTAWLSTAVGGGRADVRALTSFFRRAQALGRPRR